MGESLSDMGKRLRARADAELAAEDPSEKKRAEQEARDQKFLRDSERFLRAGGGFSWVEWCALDDDRKGAFAVVGRKLALEYADTLASRLADRLAFLVRAAK